MRNRVKEMVREGRTAIGIWISIGNPDVTEILSRAGFDFFMFDLEHGPLSIETTQTLMMAMNGSETVPMIRVAFNDPVLIKRALDIGAYGLLIPLVNTRGEAMKAVRYCKYPPEVVRGIAPRRAARFDPKYVETANEEIMIIPQIETAQAVENIDEILSVKGIDCIFIGPSDLSGSLGLIGQPDRLRHPKNLEAIERIVGAARKAKVPVATTSSLYPAKKLVEQGYNMVLAGSDTGFLTRGAEELLRSLR